jgi:hypothetical protein
MVSAARRSNFKDSKLMQVIIRKFWGDELVISVSLDIFI